MKNCRKGQYIGKACREVSLPSSYAQQDKIEHEQNSSKCISSKTKVTAVRQCYKKTMIYRLKHFFLLLLLGTLGQEKQWWLGDASTYQHPLAPLDVLMDPLSVPDVRSASRLVRDERESPQQRQRWQSGGTVLDVESEEEEAVRGFSSLYQIGC